MSGKAKSRTTPGKRRGMVPATMRDVILAVLAAVSFTVGACIGIYLFWRYGVCVW